MKFVSWNVNGIRSVLKKGFLDFAADAGADVICLQETRAEPSQVELDLPGYRQFWHPAEKKGYSGTVVLSRAEPRAVTYGIGMAKHEGEGRAITLEFPRYFLTTVYTPNAQRGLTRLAYRMEWDRDYQKFLKRLDKKKPVIFCGDLNVAHKEIDLANPKGNVNNAGFTPEEREGFDRILRSGFIDTFREFNQESGHYTWWSQMGNARAKNIGWRIDYFCISRALRARLGASRIYPEVMGSDHCPIAMELE
jgi:exodeoxyribonuclease-3